MNTKLIRFRSGEDVLCDLVSETDTELTIDNALVAVPQGQGQLGFAPWSPLAKEKQPLTIPRDYVVYIAEGNPDIVEQYEGLFATLVTPKKQLIL
ncbi:hypothetical protein T040910_162 [Synechococcus phage S-CAM3]|uniref:Uncharacterized protein n=1 Tax=Synechococcus phage S-CAM3 TaxID=1883366 RepID=A0A1D8KKG7_9CAUD|nr:hypothetical protein BOW87_gp096 [Synechococcus phage S-CAM3]AOV58666.1 hypothetical protein S250808_161 [Synechococcus phage S-CAM3]AOV58906.1 hypothetical protein T040910_162 [Synechococcus phage S-CAM3]AOV59145.1 hypothetical protein C421010_162 [Synechococcus phage S-CAM3]